MAQFKAAERFYGEKEGKEFKANEPFEMTLKRAEELQTNVKKKYDIDLGFTRLDVEEEKTAEVPKEETKEEEAPKSVTKKADKKDGEDK